jgi:hypothetical protein
VITAPCDNDITRLCLNKGENIAIAKQPGAVGTCLATILEEQQAAEAPAGSPARRLLDDDKEKAKKEVRGGWGAAAGRVSGVLAVRVLCRPAKSCPPSAG